ncbi:glycosyltransferase [Candidatus Uhrbacteria bacterium]|nr:glycosyltransferase [Candidatus Uhrbacteria bacterium]
MKIEICVPAYNEAETILRALSVLREAIPSDMAVDIVVAENGSTDGTADLVEGSGLPNVRVLRVQGKGKGLAIRTAAAQSDADIFGFIDADLSADPSVIPHLIKRIEQGSDIAIGSRMLNSDLVNRGVLRTFSSRMFNVLARVILGVRCTDTQCGLKFMNVRARQLMSRVEETGWFFDLELLALGSAGGMRIEEHPVPWEEFRFPERQSKLRVMSDGLQAIRSMFEIRRRVKTV